MDEDRQAEDLRLLYVLTVSEIGAVRRRQGAAAAGAFALQVALAGTALLLAGTDGGVQVAECVLLTVFSGLVFAGAALLLFRLARSGVRRHTDLVAITQRMSAALRTITGDRPRRDAGLTPWLLLASALATGLCI
jgi:hypothetical protein